MSKCNKRRAKSMGLHNKDFLKGETYEAFINNIFSNCRITTER